MVTVVVPGCCVRIESELGKWHVMGGMEEEEGIAGGGAWKRSV